MALGGGTSSISCFTFCLISFYFIEMLFLTSFCFSWSHPSPTVLVPALRTVGNIVTGDDSQTQVLTLVYNTNDVLLIYNFLVWDFFPAVLLYSCFFFFLIYLLLWCHFLVTYLTDLVGVGLCMWRNFTKLNSKFSILFYWRDYWMNGVGSVWFALIILVFVVWLLLSK